MARRTLARIFEAGSRIASEAWEQLRATQQYAKAAAASSSSSSSSTSTSSSPSLPGQHPPLTLDEACRILNVRPPQDGKADMDGVMRRFKRLFDLNDPERNGSLYLQSKVLRARERIEAEVRRKEEEEERLDELERGWRPRLYK